MIFFIFPYILINDYFNEGRFVLTHTIVIFSIIIVLFLIAGKQMLIELLQRLKGVRFLDDTVSFNVHGLHFEPDDLNNFIDRLVTRFDIDLQVTRPYLILDRIPPKNSTKRLYLSKHFFVDVIGERLENYYKYAELAFGFTTKQPNREDARMLQSFLELIVEAYYNTDKDEFSWKQINPLNDIR